MLVLCMTLVRDEKYCDGDDDGIDKVVKKDDD